MNNYLSVEELIKAGVHFGHPTSRWNPEFGPYIAMKRNGIHIIDMEQTSQCLGKATKEISKIVSKGGYVLFVGTKKQAKDVVQQAADKSGMFYIVERWLGGTLTNFATIKRSIKRLLLLEKESSNIYENLTKKELLMLERERIKLGDLHRGIKDMKYLPSAIFVVDANHEKIAVAEAKRLGLPTFGIVDSNTDPSMVDFPIPANDDSMKSISLIVNHIANTIIETLGGNVEEKNEVKADTTGTVEKESVEEVEEVVETSEESDAENQES